MEVGKLVAVIGDEDTVTGFLLAGVGHRTADSTNFLIVKQDTNLSQVEEAFRNLSQRDDVGIILINQHIASDIRHVLRDYNQTIPTVLEIPSKEYPYDPAQAAPSGAIGALPDIELTPAGANACSADFLPESG